MKKRYIALAIMLTAGAITSICNMYYKIGLSESLKRLLITLVVFYVIGSLFAFIIDKITMPVKNKKEKIDKESDDESVRQKGNLQKGEGK